VYGQQKEEVEVQGEERKASNSWKGLTNTLESVGQLQREENNNIKSDMTNIEKIIKSMLETRCGFTSVRNTCKEQQRNSSPHIDNTF
jgi:hypothetical protein